MPLIRTRARRTVAVPLLLAALVGCSASNGAVGKGSTDVPVEEISAGIESALSRRPDVASVNVYYTNSLTVSATAGVDVTMKPGADPQELNDEALRLVWQSGLNPLSVISVSVIDPVEPLNGVSTSVNLFEEAEREPLERAYGPHPE